MHKSAAAVGCLCLGVFVLWGKSKIERKNLSDNRVVPPVTEESAEYESHSLQRFSFGFDHAIADFLWIRLLQNADYHHLVAPGVSWEYAQINAITNLDRNYFRAYEYGSAFLSVFRNDKQGAKRILERWTVNFPQRWKPHYLYAFHLYSEMQNYKDASREMLKAAELPFSPPWLHALGLRLMSDDGQYLPALHIALNLYPSLTDPEGKERLRLRIRSLRYLLQKKQWQQALVAYRRERHGEPSSILDLQPRLVAERAVAQIEEEGQDNDEVRVLLGERFRFEYRPDLKKVVGILSPNDKVLESYGTYHPREN